MDQEGIKEDHALAREASLIMESPPTDTQGVIVDMALTSKNLNEVSHQEQNEKFLSCMRQMRLRR